MTSPTSTLDPSDTSPEIELEQLAEFEEVVKKAWNIHAKDAPTYQKLDAYVRGEHPGPYTPRNANAEYQLLVKRAISNWIPLVLAAPAQSLFVEGYRLGGEENADASKLRWAVWQRNHLDARQASVYRSTLRDGVSFAYVEKANEFHDYTKVNFFSASRCTALWEDAANDETPIAIFLIDKMPEAGKDGKARLIDATEIKSFPIKSDGSLGDGESVTTESHGFSRLPVVPFTAFRDLDGRTSGIVEHLLPIQDRINQTVFDLLIAQTYGSFKVRYATGMTPPMKQQLVDVTLKEVRNELPMDDPRRSWGADRDNEVVAQKWGPVIDETTGRPVPEPVTADASRFLMAKDPNTKFGQLDETPLNGFIESISMSVHHMAAISQVPPHHLLGDLANLSADALAVAESSLQRMVAELQHSFGESWEQVMDLFAEAQGDSTTSDQSTDPANYIEAEVMWRDMSPRSMGAVVDGLGKMVDQLGIPRRGAWRRVPGVTKAELEYWEEESKTEVEEGRGDPRAALSNSLNRANTRSQPAVPQVSADDTA